VVKPIRILILSQNYLLAYSLKSIFDSDEELEVNIQQAQEIVSISAAIDQHHPDVIVLEEQTAAINQLVTQHLFNRLPRVQIIMIHPETNWLQVLRKEEILLTHPVDLLALVKHFIL
jgi:chemotaxis response regulator CheB